MHVYECICACESDFFNRIGYRFSVQTEDKRTRNFLHVTYWEPCFVCLLHRYAWTRMDTHTYSYKNRMAQTQMYPFVTYIRIPNPYTARLSRCLLRRMEIKSLELRPEGACNPTWYRCLNKTTMWKGTFSELGSAQRCHRLGYEKYNFSRKGSVFQVLMEKITQCSGL